MSNEKRFSDEQVEASLAKAAPEAWKARGDKTGGNVISIDCDSWTSKGKQSSLHDDTLAELPAAGRKPEELDGVWDAWSAALAVIRDADAKDATCATAKAEREDAARDAARAAANAAAKATRTAADVAWDAARAAAKAAKAAAKAAVRAASDAAWEVASDAATWAATEETEREAWAAAKATRDAAKAARVAYRAVRDAYLAAAPVSK